MISRSLLPMMKARNAGHIVSVGAPFDDWPIRGFELWSSQNAGHKGLTTALLSELAGTCVRVSYVEAFAGVADDACVADRILAAITDYNGHHVRADPNMLHGHVQNMLAA
eukprot:TRINITY_DN68381_c0_g1_i1.p2 TRINITY_DN68381_c0_g1~~TRINITY_DN68381_c0_g1_i1.p2  ORF type:complete len:110 (+),score=6.42 TRINITY_DN68381_c0_g1_i1:3-332(+)